MTAIEASEPHLLDCICEICFGHRGSDLLGLTAHYDPDVTSTYRLEYAPKPLNPRPQYKQQFEYTKVPFNSKTTCQDTYVVPSRDFYKRDRLKRENAAYVPTKFEGETTTASTFDPKQLPTRPAKLLAQTYYPTKFDAETTHRADYRRFDGAKPARPRQSSETMYKPLPFEAVSTYGASFTQKQVVVDRRKVGIQLPRIQRHGDYSTTYMVDFKKFEVTAHPNRRLFCPHGKALPGRGLNPQLNTLSGNSLQMTNIGTGPGGMGGGPLLNMTS